MQIGRAVHVLHAARDARIDVAEPTISCAAETIACAPEPQTRLTVIAGTSTGSPPPIAAWRAGFILLPAWTTCPSRRAPSSAASRPARRSVSRTAAAPSSVAGTAFSEPPIGADGGAHGMAKYDVARTHGKPPRGSAISRQDGEVGRRPPRASPKNVNALAGRGPHGGAPSARTAMRAAARISSARL